MDVGNAVFALSFVFLIVELVREFFPNLDGRWKLGTAIVAGLVGVHVVAHSDWGHKDIVNGIHLDEMNEWSLIMVGLAIAGLAALTVKIGVKAISNIGQNQNGADDQSIGQG